MIIEQTNLQYVCLSMQMPLYVATATKVKENKMTKYCCCCALSIISFLFDIIWVTYHCTDNGTKVEARTYFCN